METGAISRKIERGRHTTRHSEIIPVEPGTYIMDTPGFSSLSIPGFEKEDLSDCYRNLSRLRRIAVLRDAAISVSRTAG